MGVFPIEPRVRYFDSGATRDSDSNKLDYEGFFSPKVLKTRAEYMHMHRYQSDGRLRSSDNWQNGIPVEQYMKSLWRHFMEVWECHRGIESDRIILALCALMFNAEGYMHELLRDTKEEDAERLAFDRWADSLPESGQGLSGERSPAPSFERGNETGRKARLAQEDR